MNEERKVYEQDEANKILENLYKSGKISAMDLGVGVGEETAALRSRRIHALERMADEVPITNKYPAYAPFTVIPPKRYLFNLYPSARGRSVFLSKDRLFLAKSILDEYFDFAVLSDSMHGGLSIPIVEGLFALHDANRGDELTIEILSRRWVMFWQAGAAEAGCPTVTHPAYEEGTEVAWYLRPISQPLLSIRSYFGEKIALYFAWIGHYCYFLTIPAMLGVAMEILYVV